MSPYVRVVKTASGATAVQIVYSSHRGSRDIEHIGSAHYDVQLEALKAVARQRLTVGQAELDLGLERTEPAQRSMGSGPLWIRSARMSHLWDALAHVYRVLGVRGHHRRGRGVPSTGAGLDHLAGQPASSAACGCWRRHASRRPPTAPAHAGALSLPAPGVGAAAGPPC